MGAVLGGMCAFPIRLGGDAQTGWTAEQHARTCADVLAMGRTAPFARLWFYLSGASSYTLLGYRGMNGSGLGAAPTIAVSSWEVTITWPETWEDELGREHATNIRAATAGSHYGVPSYEIAAPNVLTVHVEGIVAGSPATGAAYVYVTVYGSPLETAVLSDYGGSKDKQNCETEKIPYAEGWYQFFQEARGDAYSRERTGLVHAENLALARNYAWQTRLAEQLSTNRNPATAGVKMPEWVTVLSLDPTASDELNRAAARAKQQLRLGNTATIIDDIVSTMLGDRWVRNWRTPGTLTSPPDETYGPAWDTGPQAWDMGGGVWSSPRSKLTIEVNEPTDADVGEFVVAMGQLTRQLDDATPAYMTFNWCTGLSDTTDEDPEAVQGFRLDLDRMDYVGFS